MAYVKLAPFVVFLLVTCSILTVLPFALSGCSQMFCSLLYSSTCDDECDCVPDSPLMGECRYFGSEIARMKKIEEHPNLCQNHDDCTRKGTGKFCGNYPNPDIKYGWCFDSKIEAERFFEIATTTAVKDTNAKNLLKMALNYK